MVDPISFLETSKNGRQPKTMYYHKEITAPEKANFQEATLKEFHNHCNWNHWEQVPLENLPLVKNVLDAV